MPTFESHPLFDRELRKLTSDQRRQFRAAVATDFVPGLKAQQFHPRLRVKRVQATLKVWEMTWAPDGRVTFEYGDERLPGEPRVIWRRIGTHEIFNRP
ncbi:MAG: hypothetical protein ACRDRS_00460 [Pseudonocardiaceae bacterium]